jgi:tRNA-binding protein
MMTQEQKTSSTLSYQDFDKVDVRTGTIISAEVFKEAKKPAYKLVIDLGPGLGIKKSSAQITKKYEPQELIGMQVMCVINFAPKQIGPFISEVLTLGVPDDNGDIILVTPATQVPNGTRLS